MTKKLKELLQRAETWPEAAQEELVQIGLEIEAEQVSGVYHATPEELRAIDDAERSGIASAEEVEAAFAKFRAA
jgi:hypothetical protein